MNIAMTEPKAAVAPSLKGKVSLVTGSTSGIGLGIARALAGAGSDVVLNGFGAVRYAKLAPLVTALPVGTKLNVCTALPIVLDALSESEREFSLSPDDTAKRRADTCYPTLDALHNKLGNEEWAKVQNSITDSSDWFRASVWVTIGTTQFTLYSLLARADQGPVRTILRSFGSE